MKSRARTPHRYQARTRLAPGRNRKHHAERLKLPAGTALGIVALAALGLTYLLFCTSTEAVAQQIKAEEQTLEDLRRKVAAEEVRWNDMIGPRSLRNALARHGLNMTWPRPDQTVHIRDLALWESNDGQLNVYGRLDAAAGRASMP